MLYVRQLCRLVAVVTKHLGCKYFFLEDMWMGFNSVKARYSTVGETGIAITRLDLICKLPLIGNLC